MMIKQAFLPLLILSCSACSFDVSSQIDTSRVEVVEGKESERFETSSLDSETIRGLANSYVDSGAGEVELTVTYDPKSKKNTAMKATLEASRIAGLLVENGVPEVKTKVLPVSDSWNLSHTFVSYKTLSAEAPSDCGRMPGFEAADDVGDTKKHMDYGYGCTVESMLARQIAHPQDLLGQEDKTKTDSGRRAENVVSGRGYYGFDQFPELGGESSSE